jgi:hypothetical protein
VLFACCNLPSLPAERRKEAKKAVVREFVERNVTTGRSKMK